MQSNDLVDLLTLHYGFEFSGAAQLEENTVTRFKIYAKKSFDVHGDNPHVARVFLFLLAFLEANGQVTDIGKELWNDIVRLNDRGRSDAFSLIRDLSAPGTRETSALQRTTERMAKLVAAYQLQDIINK